MTSERDRRQKKSVTDTDSGMQQEHSRKSMFSGGREGREQPRGYPIYDVSMGLKMVVGGLNNCGK